MSKAPLALGRRVIVTGLAGSGKSTFSLAPNGSEVSIGRRRRQLDVAAGRLGRIGVKPLGSGLAVAEDDAQAFRVITHRNVLGGFAA